MVAKSPQTSKSTNTLALLQFDVKAPFMKGPYKLKALFKIVVIGSFLLSFSGCTSHEANGSPQVSPESQHSYTVVPAPTETLVETSKARAYVDIFESHRKTLSFVAVNYESEYQSCPPCGNISSAWQILVRECQSITSDVNDLKIPESKIRKLHTKTISALKKCGDETELDSKKIYQSTLALIATMNQWKKYGYKGND